MNHFKKLLNKIKFYYLKSKFILFNKKKNFSYNDLELNKYILSKTIEFRKRKIKKNLNYLRTVNFIKFIKKKNITRVLDFGGGAGYHYFIAEKLFPNLISKWIIIENKTMVHLCSNLTNSKNLFFQNSLKTHHKVDIFFSSCAINYLNNPVNTFKKISKINCKYFYFTRMPLTSQKYIKYDQYALLSENGPLESHAGKDKIVRFTNRIVSIKVFEKIFTYKKFKIIKSYIDEKKAFFYKKKFFDTYTYILKKKN
jgi:putative methyltransferase (TIGR04325 family)